MSFLLDALGKADDDRRRAMVPELRASRYQRRSPGRRALGMLLMSGAVVLSFVLGYIARPYVESRLSAEPAAIPASVTTSPAPAARPAAPLSASDKPDRASDNAVFAPLMPETPPEPVPLAESIELSVISYATQPAARFVMLDGVVMYEGDMLDEDVRLLRIKPNGVVMEKNGQEFSINLGGPR